MPENEKDKAFVEIYNTTYNKLCKYVVLKCGNVMDVTDIVQNTYLFFYKMLKKNHSIEKPIEYLYKIAKNEINRFYTDKEKRLSEIPIFSDSVDDVSLDATDLESILSVDFQADRNVELKDIWRYIKQQDVLTLKIFILYFRFDEKLTDIAKKLNISESNVKNRLYRTIKRLQKEFGIVTNNN